MDNGQLNWIANFIWGIADDVLRDVYVRGKYRDVILPMVVIRRLDAVLEPTKDAVLKMKANLDKAKIANQEAALRKSSGQAFYNASPFTLKDLKNRGKAAQLKADFETYLDGFSENVKEILQKFKFHNQIPTLHENDLIGAMIEKFLGRNIMDSYRSEVKATIAITLADQNAEIEPVPTSGGGRKPEPELDRLSNIVRSFNELFGNVPWNDKDKIRQVIAEELPPKVAADRAYQNAMKNSDKPNARIEHDKALERVMTELIADHTELFKQFSDNPGFKKWLSDIMFGATYQGGTQSAP